jgi:hypothetical protein
MSGGHLRVGKRTAGGALSKGRMRPAKSASNMAATSTAGAARRLPSGSKATP